MTTPEYVGPRPRQDELNEHAIVFRTGGWMVVRADAYSIENDMYHFSVMSADTPVVDSEVAVIPVRLVAYMAGLDEDAPVWPPAPRNEESIALERWASRPEMWQAREDAQSRQVLMSKKAFNRRITLPSGAIILLCATGDRQDGNGTTVPLGPEGATGVHLPSITVETPSAAAGIVVERVSIIDSSWDDDDYLVSTGYNWAGPMMRDDPRPWTVLLKDGTVLSIDTEGFGLSDTHYAFCSYIEGFAESEVDLVQIGKEYVASVH